ANGTYRAIRTQPSYCLLTLLRPTPSIPTQLPARAGYDLAERSVLFLRDATSVVRHALSASHGADDQKWLGASYNCLRQQGVRRFVRQILLASVKAHERTAFHRGIVAQRAAQRRIRRFERVQQRL